MKANACANSGMESGDYGPEPFVVDLGRRARCNTDYRRALWTGEHLQITLMCIPVGGDIGLERHENLDQLIVVEEGCAVIQVGREKETPQCRHRVESGYALVVPACTWHNVVNAGRTPLKLYTVYAPPKHPSGVVQHTKRDADA